MLPLCGEIKVPLKGGIMDAKRDFHAYVSPAALSDLDMNTALYLKHW